MPAEWEPHAATWLAWPHNRSDWPGKFGCIPFIFVEIIRWLSRFEGVNILVSSEAEEVVARELLVRSQVLPETALTPGRPAGRIRFFPIRTNRCWTRDSGPHLRSPQLESAVKDSAGRGDSLALQRLGQIQRLASGCAGGDRHRPGGGRSRMAARRCASMGSRASWCWKAAALT